MPATAIVTESDCAVVMLLDAGVTVTVGVVGFEPVPPPEPPLLELLLELPPLELLLELPPLELLLELLVAGVTVSVAVAAGEVAAALVQVSE